jgi:hypothetical protein
MASPPEVGVVVRTEIERFASLVALLALLGTARADPDDAAIIGEDPGWRLEEVQLRTTYLDQRGNGYQAQSLTLGDTAPNSEAMTVVQPALYVVLRQSERVVHRIALPIDAITAASPDAVDATSSASRFNTAGDLDVRTSIAVTEHDEVTTRFVAHAEEWIGGGTLGAGWKRKLADDNATLAVSGTLGYDVFDQHDHFGSYLGKTGRTTASASAGGSQLLSPTTVLDGSYGLTYQRGSLETGWNAVPIANGMLTDEVVPDARLRHTLVAGVAQHVPATRSTVKARYRYYRDDFGIAAHSAELIGYQYVVDWMYLRGSYRYHRQGAADFYTESLAPGFGSTTLRTADSDLARFAAHEVGLGVATVRGRGPLRAWSVTAEVLRYDRSNDLAITAVSLGLGRTL